MHIFFFFPPTDRPLSYCGGYIRSIETRTSLSGYSFMIYDFLLLVFTTLMFSCSNFSQRFHPWGVFPHVNLKDQKVYGLLATKYKHQT